MTPNQPPKIASWLLKHFGCGPNNETLLGDLAEQYLQKNSATWYWRQALKAIPVSFCREVRGHKRAAVSALLTGWAMWILGGTLIFPLAFFGTNLGYVFVSNDPIGSAWSFMWMPVLGPENLHEPAFAFVAFATALPFIVGTVCGWLVSRCQIGARSHPIAIQISRVHRDQKTGLVLLFAGSILLIDLLLFGPFVLQVGRAVAYSFAGRLAANVAASVLGIVLGGGLLRDHSRVV
jgi:hypothetical protein